MSKIEDTTPDAHHDPAHVHAGAPGFVPSAWICRHAHHILPGGRVLDVAAGYGRNTRWLLEQGYRVEAVDINQAALDSLQHLPGIRLRQADLEQAAWPYANEQDEQFDGIVVCRYLHRPLMNLLAATLKPGGILIYETFMQGQQAHGRPHNPDFLLAEDELLKIYMPQLKILAFEQGMLEQNPPAMLQRICALKAEK